MPAEKSDDFSGTVKRLARLMRPDAAMITVVVVAAVLGVIAATILPAILGNATDTIIHGAFSPAGIDSHRFTRELITAAVLLVLAAIFNWIQSHLLADVVQRAMQRLRSQVEDKLGTVPLGYIDTTPTGDLLSRVTNDIDNLGTSLQQSIAQVMTSSMTVIGVVIAMLWIDWLLGLIALVTIPVAFGLVKLVTSRSKRRFIALWRHTGDLNAQTEEAFTGHALVKVYGQSAATRERFAATNEQLYEAGFRAQFMAGLIQPAMMFLGNLNFVAIALIGGLRVASGQMTIGDIQAFIQYSRRFTQPITQIASMANVLQSGVASAERVFHLLDVEDQPADAHPALRVENPSGRVTFDDVWFSYSPDKPLIEGLSLVADAGQTVAIVGPTGAGKTTLVNLLMRFYDLDRGRILLDGVDTARMTRDDLRSNMGMVLQDTWLFGGTIRENIAYGNLEATEEQILTAARACYVDRFVHSLPDGYDTVLDDDVAAVSAGEKQLITIARAFVAQPTILILDEATSSVDTRTEVLIQHAMSALRKGRTSFVIAHRLSTIRDADTILVMENGRIVEHGNHDALVESGGAYAKLYNAQFAGVET
ncbi:MAG: ABC transporter ATP-binding protein [Actinobacteria bacterium]|nr:ABC transporter ATP-binding protein [Actinomycetota bacterium]